jgi:hypothetical protein
MSYGPSYPVLFQCAADFVNKILCGTKPGERAIAALHCTSRVLALTDEPASVERTAAIRPAADINPLARRGCLG